MTRYIDADKIPWRTEHNPIRARDSITGEVHVVTTVPARFVYEKQIDLMPRVDAVEVVRCKDCRYFEGKQNIPCERCLADKPTEPCGLCSYIGGCVEEDGYCYRGRKKDGDGK